jgi:hypothetical protein
MRPPAGGRQYIYWYPSLHPPIPRFFGAIDLRGQNYVSSVLQYFYIHDMPDLIWRAAIITTPKRGLFVPNCNTV